MNVLRVIANPKPVEQSASLKIEAAFMVALQQKHPDAQVTTINVFQDDVPQLDALLLPAFFGAPPANAEIERRRDRQRELLAMFLAADLVVIASPVWNFNGPPQLKAFIDAIMVAGKTFKYTANGPVGLVPEKKVVVCYASGMLYDHGQPPQQTLTTMLTTQLGFMGITNVTLIGAQGQGAGREKATATLAAAIEKAQAAAAQF